MYYHIKSIKLLSSSSGNIIASAFLIIVPFMGCNRTIVMTIFIIAMILKAPFYCGIRINHLDLSVHFPGILNAFVNGLGSISGILTPYVIGLVAKDVSCISMIFKLT